MPSKRERGKQRRAEKDDRRSKEAFYRQLSASGLRIITTSPQHVPTEMVQAIGSANVVQYTPEVLRDTIVDSYRTASVTRSYSTAPVSTAAITHSWTNGSLSSDIDNLVQQMLHQPNVNYCSG